MLVLLALLAIFNGGTIVPNDIQSGYPDVTGPTAGAPHHPASVDDIATGYPDHP
jgi:hypothetical protein